MGMSLVTSLRYLTILSIKLCEWMNEWMKMVIITNRLCLVILRPPLRPHLKMSVQWVFHRGIKNTFCTCANHHSAGLNWVNIIIHKLSSSTSRGAQDLIHFHDAICTWISCLIGTLHNKRKERWDCYIFIFAHIKREGPTKYLIPITLY